MRMRKFSPIISVESCKGCLICLYTCKKRGPGIMAESGERTDMGGVLPVVVGECTGCRLCEWVCPDFAISVEEVGTC